MYKLKKVQVIDVRIKDAKSPKVQFGLPCHHRFSLMISISSVAFPIALFYNCSYPQSIDCERSDNDSTMMSEFLIARNRNSESLGSDILEHGVNRPGRKRVKEDRLPARNDGPKSAIGSMNSERVLIPGGDPKSEVLPNAPLTPPGPMSQHRRTEKPRLLGGKPRLSAGVPIVAPALTEAEEFANLRKKRYKPCVLPSLGQGLSSPFPCRCRYERAVNVSLDDLIHRKAKSGVLSAIDTTMPSGYIPPIQGTTSPTGPFQYIPYPYLVNRTIQQQIPPPQYYPVHIQQTSEGSSGNRLYLAWLIAALFVVGVGVTTGVGICVYRKRKKGQKQKESRIFAPPVQPLISPSRSPLSEPDVQEFGVVGFVPMVDTPY